MLLLFCRQSACYTIFMWSEAKYLRSSLHLLHLLHSLQELCDTPDGYEYQATCLSRHLVQIVLWDIIFRDITFEISHFDISHFRKSESIPGFLLALQLAFLSIAMLC